MTPAEKEVAAVNDAYARALSAYGSQVIAKALTEWNAVNFSSAAGKTVMVARMIALVVAAREVLAVLAIRRMQLTQALMRGNQLADGPDKASTLQELRDAYNESLEDIGVPRAKRAVSLLPNTPIPISDETGSLADVLRNINDAIEDETEGTITHFGGVRLARIAKREGIVLPDDVKRSQRLTASGIERISLNGARDADAVITKLNKDVKGWVRKHNDHAGDEPCGFCAMLLSRGPVYRSKQSAEGFSGNEYHLLCHCTAEAVYSTAQYKNNPAYALNRALQVEWKNNIAGKHSGSDAVSAWRKHVKDYFSATAGAAQEAA